VLRGDSLHKIPSSREDVFSDDSLSMREKRALMKFLRFVLQPEQREQSAETPPGPQNLKQALEERFNVPESMQAPILALALASEPANATDFDNALQRVSRHMRSIGYFGPGFGAVIAKYGGNAEIAQVACRAQAVGGGVYLLGQGIENIESSEPSSDNRLLRVTLSDGTSLRTHRVAGSIDDLPGTHLVSQTSHVEILHSISIVSDPLKSLFPQTSENGPVPAAAIVLVENMMEPGAAPVYLQVHSEDTGECPAGQCESMFSFHLYF
jgi:Rab proteins geranylgeranyltransferase component A